MTISIPSTCVMADDGLGIQHCSFSLFQDRIRYMLSAFLSLARTAFLSFTHNCRKSNSRSPIKGASATHNLPWAFLGTPGIAELSFFQPFALTPPLNMGLAPAVASIMVLL